MTFGKRLLYYIERANMSQKELADRINVTPTRLNYWVKDKRKPDVYHIKALAEALNIPSDALLGTDTAENVISDEAKSIASKYDKLSAPGKELVRFAVSFAGKYFNNRKPIDISIPLKNIGMINGVPLYDTTPYSVLYAKEMAKSEVREMERDSVKDVE